MRELSSTQIMLSPKAAHEWRAMEQSALLYHATFQQADVSVRYRHTELGDGTLELAVEIQEQPFPHGMYLRIPPQYWRKVKGDT